MLTIYRKHVHNHEINLIEILDKRYPISTIYRNEIITRL